MPLCTLKTNLVASLIPKDFHLKFVKYIASLLKKDIEKITLVVEPGVEISRAGSLDPNCYLSIQSINVFNAEKNKEYGPSLRSFIAENLPLQPNRIVITLLDLKATDLV
ncbi:D-dopachrome decarboxylase-like [Ornithodoros turicata]|uniref:D-dopachrome decarboxylase n=1 Tax=Ornithodoros turicata TaxID=34597 RepID=A0A2R5LF25_9ACAR